MKFTRAERSVSCLPRSCSQVNFRFGYLRPVSVHLLAGVLKVSTQFLSSWSMSFGALGLETVIGHHLHQGRLWAVHVLSRRAAARLCKGRNLRLADVGADCCEGLETALCDPMCATQHKSNGFTVTNINAHPATLLNATSDAWPLMPDAISYQTCPYSTRVTSTKNPANGPSMISAFCPIFGRFASLISTS